MENLKIVFSDLRIHGVLVGVKMDISG